MNGNHRDVALFAVTTQNVIYCRIVDRRLYKNGLIHRQALYQFRKLNDQLPIDLNLSNRRLILCRLKSPLSLVIPSLIDVKSLMGKVEIFRGERKRLGESHSSLCH